MSGQRQPFDRYYASLRLRAMTQSADPDRSRRSADELMRELEHTKRFAHAIDRMSSAVVEAGTLDELLQRLIELFAEVAMVDAAVIRVRDGDRLRSRAAVGLQDEVAAGFSVPI